MTGWRPSLHRVTRLFGGFNDLVAMHDVSVMV